MSEDNTQTNVEEQNNDGFREMGRRQNRHQNRQDVLQKVAQGDLQPDEAERMLRKRLPPRFVVTRNGAIALYNLKRDPIVLYADQWEKLSSLIERGILKTYMSRNENIIKRRPRPVRPQTQDEQSTEQGVNDETPTE
jgi:hypothetical protein